MTAKEYLNTARYIEQGIKNMSSQLESLRALAVNVSPVYSSTPHASTRNIYKTENIIITILDLENKIEKESIKFSKILKTINNLCDPMKEAILINRYIKGLYWDDIAYDLKISVRRAYQIHREALADVDKILSKNLQ